MPTEGPKCHRCETLLTDDEKTGVYSHNRPGTGYRICLGVLRHLEIPVYLCTKCVIAVLETALLKRDGPVVDEVFGEENPDV